MSNNTTRTALVVEDDRLLVHLLKVILEREGFVIVEAADGLAARTWIDNAPAPPDLITLDVLLPHANGYQLLESIRAKDGWKTVPVIMLSAKSQEQDVVRALDSGASDYVVKPFKPEEFRARIRRLLKS